MITKTICAFCEKEINLAGEWSVEQKKNIYHTCEPVMASQNCDVDSFYKTQAIYEGHDWEYYKENVS